jgi:hypothetical protein
MLEPPDALRHDPRTMKVVLSGSAWRAAVR